MCSSGGALKSSLVARVLMRSAGSQVRLLLCTNTMPVYLAVSTTVAYAAATTHRPKQASRASTGPKNEQPSPKKARTHHYHAY